jgi:glycosyltransferase involved in cell wall biosynthesis
VLSVSVITPSYNQGEFLERTIESVLSQEVPRLEYLVVDGRSTDATLQILQRYEGRLRWVSESDRGQAHAINKGIAATSGDIVAWLNSDDMYFEGAVAAASRFLEEHPEVDLVYGDGYYVDRDDRRLDPYQTEPWDLTRFLDACYICQPSVFFRRRMVERHGVLDERLHYCLDYEYWLRLALRGAHFAYLPRLQAGYRLYAETKTVGSRVALHREVNDMLRRTLGNVPDRWLYSFAHAVAESRGLTRETRLRFAAASSLVSCYGALRWNRRITPGHLVTTARWLGGNARVTLREALSL